MVCAAIPKIALGFPANNYVSLRLNDKVNGRHVTLLSSQEHTHLKYRIWEKVQCAPQKAPLQLTKDT